MLYRVTPDKPSDIAKANLYCCTSSFLLLVAMPFCSVRSFVDHQMIKRPRSMRSCGQGATSNVSPLTTSAAGNRTFAKAMGIAGSSSGQQANHNLGHQKHIKKRKKGPSSNKCIASSNKCFTSSNKKLVETIS